MKKFLIFTSFCLGINVCHADYITFDTAALDTAINEITRIGSDSPYKTVEEAGDALYDAFYAAKKGNTVDSDVVMDKCFYEIVKIGRICNNFITRYNSNLNHANFCISANNRGEKVTYLSHSATFEECQRMRDINGYENGKITRGERYEGDSIAGQCKDWIKAVEMCSKYLGGYYTQKLSETGLSNEDKKKYECLLEKVETGNITVPLSKMENSCKQ